MRNKLRIKAAANSPCIPARAGRGLKVIINPRLFHNFIGHVPGLNFPVNREGVVSYGAVPDIMIAFATPFEKAAVFI
jgi:hypothetical protein